MAIEFCPENTVGGSSGGNSRGMSPRISFSHEFGNIIPIEPHIPLHPSLLDSAAAADFDFCVRENACHDQQSTSADELFSNGVIIPSVQIKKQNALLRPTAADQKLYGDDSKAEPPPSVPPPAAEGGPKEDAKGASDSREDEEQLQRSSSSSSSSNSKSFWGFKRSRSLNCGSLCKGGLCPLPLLSRSKSTGSTSSSKKSLILSNKEDHYHPQRHRPHHQRRENSLKKDQSNPPSVSGFRFSEPFSSSRMAMHDSQHQHQKPPLMKKTNHSQGSVLNGGNNGVLPVNAILNVPSASVFGFGSIFSVGGKQKSGKKK